MQREGIRRFMFSVSVPIVKIKSLLKRLYQFIKRGGI